MAALGEYCNFIRAYDGGKSSVSIINLGRCWEIRFSAGDFNGCFGSKTCLCWVEFWGGWCERSLFLLSNCNFSDVEYKCTFYHKQVSLYLLYVWCAKFSSENSTRRETSTCLAEKPQTRTFSHCNRKLYISVAVSYFLFRTLKIV